MHSQGGGGRFTLLYSIENVRCKDSVRKRLKGAINTEAANFSDGTANFFFFYESLQRLFRRNRTGEENNYSYSRNHSFCARNRYDILFIHAFILNKYYLLVVIAQYKCFACVFQFVISKVFRFGSSICQHEQVT